MSKIWGGLVLAMVVALSGCATVTEAGYYWGKYAATLYAYTENPSDETLAAHTQELERIVTESAERDLRVPPGVHAELGYIQAGQGENTAAIGNYEQEMALYPESRVFLERLVGMNKQEDE